MPNRTLRVIVLSLVLFCGVIVRAADLGTHFSHIDDLNSAIALIYHNDRSNPLGSYLGRIFAVSEQTTYAPLQYFFTALLLAPGLAYSDVLLLGRTVPFMLGIAGMLLMVLFYRLFRGPKAFSEMVLAVTILAFSWENIIYAKHMSSYAVGVTAAVGVLIILLIMLRSEQWSIPRMLLLGLTVGILSSAQYQVIFFLPALFVVLFVHRSSRSGAASVLPGLTIAGSVSLLFIAPLYYFFIRTVPVKAAYISWNGGPAGEYAFSTPPGAGEAVVYVAKFFTVNFIDVFRSMTAFLPEGHGVAWAATALFLLFFFAGLVSFIDTNDRDRRMIGIFFTLTAATWAVLIVMQRLSFGPTRHSLILLPLFSVGISEGAGYLIRKMRDQRLRERLENWAPIALAALIAAGNLTSAPAMAAARHDKFDEQEMLRMLSEQRVSLVVQNDWTANLLVMPSIARKYPIISNFTYTPTDMQRLLIAQIPQDAAVAFVSHRAPLTPAVTGLMAERGFRPVFIRDIPSDVEIEYSSRTEAGTNGLYVSVYAGKEMKAR